MTRPGRVEVYRDEASGWRWRRFAPNGVQIGAATQGYERLRDLVRNLEQNFPGFRLLDQDCALVGPAWGLWGHEVNDDTAGYFPLPPGVVLGVGLRGCWIPVSVPPGVSLSSRRKL